MAATFKFTTLANGRVKVEITGTTAYATADRLQDTTHLPSDLRVRKSINGNGAVIVSAYSPDAKVINSEIMPAVDTVILNNGTPIAANSMTQDQLFDALSEHAVFQKANSGNGGSGLLPVDSSMVYIGDSITSYGFVTYAISGGSAYNNNNLGFVNYANLLSGSRLFVPVGGNKGVPGDTTGLVLARMGAILALAPKVAILEIGTNDINAGVTAAAIQENLTAIIDALKAINCKVFCLTVLPRFGANVLTAPKEAIRVAVNTFIKNNTDTVAVDVESITAADLSDGLHPNAAGAYKIGKLVADKIAPFLASGNVANTLFADTALTGSPLMSGTGGSVSSATGTVAPGWQLTGADAGGATVVGSKSAEDKQVITISGSKTGSARRVELVHTKSLSGQLVNGSIAEGILDIEILTPMTGIATVDFVIKAYSGDYGTQFLEARALFASDVTQDSPLPVGRYTLKTAPAALTGTPGNMNHFVTITLKDGSISVAGSFKIWRAGVRKIA